ncbi:hypothetical protein Aau02nite_82210 [Amorphoplanes auranticolor]|uniref:Uncharacterized protein n=1 Tax=Actinoplanes auranticolor TaxID=47988 RepID=A0A919VWU5_9ACTN|nr:hypothetical protein Aau02nite_82210 [Actinoplanes auranticolor]
MAPAAGTETMARHHCRATDHHGDEKQQENEQIGEHGCLQAAMRSRPAAQALPDERPVGSRSTVGHRFRLSARMNGHAIQSVDSQQPSSKSAYGDP